MQKMTDDRFETVPAFDNGELPKVVCPLWADDYAKFGMHPENLSTEVVYKLSDDTFAVSPDGMGLYYYDTYFDALEMF